MSKGKRSRTEQQKQSQRTRTARNQIKRYEKALASANEKSREAILQKIEFYKKQLMS